MAQHQDYCPISVGVEVLGDRWTPLVIRELGVGAGHFNEIHRGIPRISRTLLAQRLRVLERQGLVTRVVSERGKQGRYELTPGGQALVPIVWSMGRWAAEWVFRDPADKQVDGLSLIWRMQQFAVSDKLPAQRTVVHVLLRGQQPAEAWLDLQDGAATVCRDDPGYNVDLAMEAAIPGVQRWLVGRVPFTALLKQGEARLLGPSKLVRAFPSWFDTTTFQDSYARGEAKAPQLESVSA